MQSDRNISELLQRYERFGVDLGLIRIEHLLGRLGNPQLGVPIVHVAGTNGKGSVCAYLSKVLSVAGYRVGCYTSPHLVRWNERISLSGQPIDSEALRFYLETVEAAIDSAEPTPTQFEVFTAAAWQFFADQSADIAVIEVGLGGRLDATNVCAEPLVSVITSISLEHWQRLGPTVAHIAREKAGILKSGRPVVAGRLPPDAEVVVTQRASELGCKLYWIEPAHAVALDSSIGEASLQTLNQALLEYGLPGTEPIQYCQSLLGQHQQQNSAVAIAALQLLQSQGWKISRSAIQAGMAEAQWPGRLQWSTWEGQSILLDGAHNPAAAEVLRQYVNDCLSSQGLARGAEEAEGAEEAGGAEGTEGARRVAWLMGMLATKDHQKVFRALLRPGDSLALVPVSGHLSATPEDLAALAQEVCPDLAEIICHDSLKTGLAALTAKPAAIKVFCGSLYLLGEFFAMNETPNANR